MTQILQNHTQSPLIGIIVEEKGKEVVRYFTDEKAADAAVSQNATQEALAVIGAWSDLDWNETVAALDRIRHESKPTPPIKDEALFTRYRTSGSTPSCPPFGG